MHRIIFLFFSLLIAVSNTSLAYTSHHKTIEDSPALKEVLRAISLAYANGPTFNGFHYSDEFSFFVIESRQPEFSWVDPEVVVKNFSSLIENALDWGGKYEKKLLEEKRQQAVNDLKQILGKQRFKLYSDMNQHGSEHRSETYFISDGYQLWFEETWAD